VLLLREGDTHNRATRISEIQSDTYRSLRLSDAEVLDFQIQKLPLSQPSSHSPTHSVSLSLSSSISFSTSLSLALSLSVFLLFVLLCSLSCVYASEENNFSERLTPN